MEHCQNLEVIKHLINSCGLKSYVRFDSRKPKNPRFRIYRGTNPLVQAMAYQKYHLVKAMVEVSTSPENLGDALVSAAGRGHLDIVVLICNKGKWSGDISKIDYQKALYSAFCGYYIHVVEYLFSQGAKPGDLLNAVTLARECEQRTAIIVVSTRHNDNKFKCQAVDTLHRKLKLFLHMVIHYGGDVNERCPESRGTALWRACIGGSVCLVLELLKLGADVHLLVERDNGKTCLETVVHNLSAPFVSKDRRFNLHHIALIVICYITKWHKENWTHEFLANNGEQCQMKLDEIKFLIHKASSNVSHLMQLCRAAIRQSLHSDCDMKIPQLGLPTSLSDYLLLKDLNTVYLQSESLQAQIKDSSDIYLGNIKSSRSCLCLQARQVPDK